MYDELYRRALLEQGKPRNDDERLAAQVAAEQGAIERMCPLLSAYMKGELRGAWEVYRDELARNNAVALEVADALASIHIWRGARDEMTKLAAAVIRPGVDGGHPLAVFSRSLVAGERETRISWALAQWADVPVKVLLEQ